MVIRKLNKKLAFSLIELSITILVIAIVMIAVMKGTDLINISRKTAAGATTKDSPVNKISNLVVWYESTLDSSFKTSELKDGKSISLWNDMSGNNPNNANNANQTTTTNQPTYIANAINGLPALRFNTQFDNDYLNYDGTAIAKSNYSVFVVEQRRASSSGKNHENNFLSGEGESLDTKFSLGYIEYSNPSAYSVIKFGHWGNDYIITVNPYTSPIPRIHSAIFNSSTGRFYYINGVNQTLTCDGSCNPNRGLISNLNATIGGYPNQNYFYWGDIGEIIIYKKALTDQERQDVETYLSKKWSIAF